MTGYVYLPTEAPEVVSQVPVTGIGDQSPSLIKELLHLKAEPRFWAFLAHGCLLDGNIPAALDVLRSFRDDATKKDPTEDQNDEERSLVYSLLSELENQNLFRVESLNRRQELEAAHQTAAEAAALAKTEVLPALRQGMMHLLKGETKKAENHFSVVGRTRHQNQRCLLSHVALAMTHFQNKDYPKALTYLLHVLRNLGSKRTPMEIRMIIGFCFLEMGKLDFAIKLFERCSQSIGAKYGLISAYLRKYTNQEHHRAENLTRVLELILEWVTLHDEDPLLNPFDATMLLVVAKLFLVTGQYASSSQIGKQACDLADTDAILAEGYLLQARSKHALGQFNEAMGLYSQALVLKPDMPLARYGLSQMYIASDHVRNAATSLEQIISLSLKESLGPELTKTASAVQHVSLQCGGPSQITKHHVGDCLKLLSVLYPKLPPGTAEGKETRWLEALQAQNGDEKIVHTIPEDFVALGQLVKGKEQVAAFSRALNLYKENEDFVAKHNGAVEAYNSKRGLPEAGPLVEMLQIPSTPLYVHCNAAAAFFKRYKECAFDWKECLQEANENTKIALELYNDQTPPISKITLLFNQGRMHEELRQYHEAAKIYKDIIERIPEYLEAHLHLINVSVKMGDIEGAKSQSKESLKVFPWSPIIRDLMGAFYLEHGNYIKSKELLHSVTKGDFPKDVVALVLLGNLNYRTAPQDLNTSANRQKAKDHYLKALDYYRSALTIDQHCIYAAQGTSAVIGQFGRCLEIPKLYEKIVDLSSCRHWAASQWSFANPILMPAAEVNLGHLWFLKKQFSHCINLYNYALEVCRRNGHPDESIRILIARAQYDSHARFQDAVETLSCLAHIHPWDKTIKFNLALVLQGEGVHFIMRFREPKALADDSLLKEIQSALGKIDQAIQLYNSLKISAEESTLPLKLSLFEDQIAICNEYKEKGEKASVALMQLLKRQEVQDQAFKKEWEEYLEKQKEETRREEEEKKKELQIQEARDHAYQVERSKKKAELEKTQTPVEISNQRKRSRSQVLSHPKKYQSIPLSSGAFMNSTSHLQLEESPSRDPYFSTSLGASMMMQESRPRAVVEDKELEDDDEEGEGEDDVEPRAAVKSRRITLSPNDEDAME